ncbi:FtsK/SpoIIIE domain-containing protein [Cellulomonas oligotrophica]|uniref:FtsK/SpoIIIE domain-containing protein n=1 Tax=Cellulomonas oligotrophica TaxID=931536 RepID=UPI0031E8EC30
MRTRLTIRRPHGGTHDVVVTTDAGATVADVADALARAADADPGAPATLVVEPPDGGPARALPRTTGVVEAGLQAGSTVTLAPAGDDATAPGPAHARVDVVAGPDAGLTVDLPPGTSTVGRGPAATVRLTDRLVARTHARVVVGDGVEVVDAGSADGVVVGAGRVDRAVLGPGDLVVLGETVLRVRRLGGVATGAGAPGPDAHGRGTRGADVPFNRSPRVVARHPDGTVDLPAPPDPPRRDPFPLLALAAPVLLALVLLLVWRNPLSLAFVAVSPLLTVGTWVERRVTERRRVAEATARFDAALTACEDELVAARTAERTARLAALASTHEALAAARTRAPLLWSRRADGTDFLVLRAGLGTTPARTRPVVPGAPDADPAHRDRARALADRFVDVDDVPLAVALRASGGLGVAGEDAAVDAVARALVAQLVALHAPSEVALAVVTSARHRERWAWTVWLPHVASPHSPLPGLHAAADAAAAAGLVAALEELVASRADRHGRAGRVTAVPAVVVVVDDDAPADRARLVRLAEDGPAVGVHVLWCAGSVAALPSACRAVLDVDAGALGDVPDGTWRAVATEVLGAAEATALARSLCPVVDAGAPVHDESDLPRAVPGTEVVGGDGLDDPVAVLDRWHATGSVLDRSGPPVRRRTDATLRAVVGRGAQGPFVLDLRAQGPHALVGGTTGAGKSELLQAWVLGMAAAHGPDRVTFLLVDYKGGAAFADCVDLPHTVGLVTDLTPHLVRRALASLRAELRRRERLLQRKQVPDLLALERLGDPETPPALVIVVDEFAALVTDVPEFVDGVVDVAQRGRSLGLHLVLATQRPAGVIKDNLRANTNLRIALRMADEHDSTDVLGSALAAGIDPATPGRGAVRTGPGRLALFQTAFVGGRSAGAPPRAAVRVATLGLGPGEPWDVPAPPAPAVDDDGPSDAARLVAAVRAAADVAGVPAPRRPWLPELAPCVDLASLPPGAGALALGLVDRPAAQEQEPWCWAPDVDGALAVVGAGGTGRSTALRTVAAAAARDVLAGGGPVHVHAVDAGAGVLGGLEVLPVLGSVLDVADAERVLRLLRDLVALLDDRARRWASVQAGSLPEYRVRAGRPDEPRVLLLLDGIGAVRDAYEGEGGRAGAWALLQRVVAEGRPLGVHVALTAERPGAVPTALAAAVGCRLVLRQADAGAYAQLGVRGDVLGPDAPPGRGVDARTGDEVQVAVPSASPVVADQAGALAALAARLDAAGTPRTPPVRRLPAVVRAADLPAAVDGLPLLGVADDTLEPVGVDPHGTFLVAGLPGSGRTTALLALSGALRRALPDAHLALVGPARSPLPAAVAWDDVARGADDARGLAAALAARLAVPADEGHVVLVVEQIADLLGGPAEQALTEAVRAARRQGHLVLAEAETTAWGSSWPLVAEVRNGRRGLVLQPDTVDVETLFRTSAGRLRRGDQPPGRGLWVEQGRARRVQVPLPG